jgi:hypothetical protein
MEQSYYEKNKAKILEKRKIYYQNNKQNIIKNNIAYQKNNTDKTKLYIKKYNSKPDIKNKHNIQSKQYYKDNKADIIQRQHAYRQTDNYRIALKKYNKKRRIKRRQANHDNTDKKTNMNKHEDNIVNGKYILRLS